MKRVKILGLCLVSALAIGAVSATVSSAVEYELTGLPELGRCVKVTTPKTGEYREGQCTKEAEGKGEYNWMPGPGAKPKFTGIGQEATLQAVGGAKNIFCDASEFTTGEYTGGKTLKATVELVGCTYVPTGQLCQTNPADPGEMELTTEGEIGFIKKSGKVGLDLKISPNPVICGKLPEELTTAKIVTLEGSVIGRIKKLHNMVLENKVGYTESEGKQIPEKFEGGVKDTLLEKVVEGTTTTEAQVGLADKSISIENEEKIEIKNRTVGA